VPGDLVELPQSQLAILTGTAHESLLGRVDGSTDRWVPLTPPALMGDRGQRSIHVIVL
jgi:hypothetical protein